MMDITLHTIPIRDIVEGFVDNQEEGVVGYGGKLNIRPPFQREFVYNETQKKEVINSIFKGFPLNVMYWIRNENGTFELLDGQQRTLSICSYYNGDFSINQEGSPRGFINLSPEQQEKFLSYELQIYICENGTTDEQWKWFEIINIAGEKLTKQELRNAYYTGSWVMDAKWRFSKTGCAAFRLGEKYMSGTPIRQDYLETVLKWISGGDIDEYMRKHQHDPNADREWQYFQQVIAWVKTLFPTYRNEMRGVAWGELYNKCKDNEYSATDLENKVAQLMMDDDVTNNKGVYDYVLTGDERKLNIRAFTPKMKRSAYERQKGICAKCKKHFELEGMEADHITPWSKGGTTTADNCQMLCVSCNRTKSDI